jgi:hypothetical protein
LRRSLQSGLAPFDSVRKPLAGLITRLQGQCHVFGDGLVARCRSAMSASPNRTEAGRGRRSEMQCCQPGWITPARTQPDRRALPRGRPPRRSADDSRNRCVGSSPKPAGQKHSAPTVPGLPAPLTPPTKCTVATSRSPNRVTRIFLGARLAASQFWSERINPNAHRDNGKTLILAADARWRGAPAAAARPPRRR